MTTAIVACAPSVAPPVGFESVTRNDSEPSWRVSARIGMVIVFVVSLTPKVSVPAVAT
jgi:hypothetical protein